jgi:hypothetical protein
MPPLLHLLELRTNHIKDELYSCESFLTEKKYLEDYNRILIVENMFIQKQLYIIHAKLNNPFKDQWAIWLATKVY